MRTRDKKREAREEAARKLAGYAPANVMLSIPPLVGTMRESEAEAAAALLVRACQVAGAWRGMRPRDINRMIQERIAARDRWFLNLEQNPAFRPDFRALVRGGFARFVGDPNAGGCPVEFTKAGFDAMRSHVIIPNPCMSIVR